MKSQLSKLLLLAAAYLCVEIATSALRGVSFIISSSVMFPAYFLLTFWVCKRWISQKPWKIVVAATVALLLPSVLASTEFFQVGHPDVLFRLLGVWGGAFFFKAKTLPRCLIAGLAVALMLCFTPLWWAWINYRNYGSFQTTTDATITRPLVLTNPTDTLILNRQPGKTYVLDLWNSYCGHCVRKFPDFQALADKYRNGDKIAFCLVDVFERKDDPHLLDTPRRHGCRLPSFAFEDDEFLARLGIQGVPVILIILPDGKVAYRGPIERVERHLKRLSCGKS